MNAGVAISPLGVEITPVRARPSVAFKENENFEVITKTTYDSFSAHSSPPAAKSTLAINTLTLPRDLPQGAPTNTLLSEATQKGGFVPNSAAKLAFMAGVLIACDREISPQVPPGLPEDFVRAADILVAAQCELDAAVAAAPEEFAVKKAELTLTLTVQRVEAVGGGVTLGIPIAGTNLTLSRDRTPRGATFREMDFRITHEIGTAPECPTKEAPLTTNGVRFIEGGLGLAEWINESAGLSRKSGETPTAVKKTMIFEVALSSALSPVFDQPIDELSSTLASRDSDNREVRHRLIATTLPTAPGQRPASDTDLRQAAQDFLSRTDS